MDNYNYDERRAAIYARGSGPWIEALHVFAAKITPRWRWNELARHRGTPAKVGCRICSRRPQRQTAASLDDCDLDQPDQLFVMPVRGDEVFFTYCREHYVDYWNKSCTYTIPSPEQQQTGCNPGC